jgi:indole-3-pyruvate monooxygenase
MLPRQTNTIIIGASISGLASAAALKKYNIDYLLLEKNGQTCSPWRTHYDRLHLHTSKAFSHLPYKKFNRDIPRYPSRQQVVDYLDDYQQTFAIEPILHTRATSVKREEDHWLTSTNNGTFRSTNLIMATGAFNEPKPIHFKGLDTYPGKVLHSCAYKTGADFRGQRVLVVGFGNSACEIAIDLHEQGASPAMAVRSAVNVVPRDIFGLPIVELSAVLGIFPPGVADAISAPLLRLLVGDLDKLGLKKKPYGPLEEIRRDQRSPILDIGTIGHIRAGHIRIFDDIDHIEGNTVHFQNARTATFDAIIAAIGYERDYAGIVEMDSKRVAEIQTPIARQKYFGMDGLYCCGYWISPTGQIRSIASEAKKIARHIHNALPRSASPRRHPLHPTKENMS